MTTIAWDGTTLAVDRQATTEGNFRYAVNKMQDLSDERGPRLFTSCGDQGLNHSVAAWLRAGKPEAAKPVVEEKTQFTGTLVELSAGKPRITMITKHLVFIECDASEPYSDGSGHEYAIMAMHLGVDAVNAVWHTMQFDTTTGLGIDWARLDGKRGRVEFQRAPVPCAGFVDLDKQRTEFVRIEV